MTTTASRCRAPGGQRGDRRVVDHRPQAREVPPLRPGRPSARSKGSHRRKRRRWVQVSRLGNPLVNEVVIPLGKKDQFNRTTPDRDAKLYGKYVVKPELAGMLNALFDLGAPETTARTSCRRCSRVSRS